MCRKVSRATEPRNARGSVGVFLVDASRLLIRQFEKTKGPGGVLVQRQLEFWLGHVSDMMADIVSEGSRHRAA
jgi:hypothetical protein